MRHAAAWKQCRVHTRTLSPKTLDGAHLRCRRTAGCPGAPAAAAPSPAGPADWWRRSQTGRRSCLLSRPRKTHVSQPWVAPITNRSPLVPAQPSTRHQHGASYDALAQHDNKITELAFQHHEHRISRHPAWHQHSTVHAQHWTAGGAHQGKPTSTHRSGRRQFPPAAGRPPGP